MARAVADEEDKVFTPIMKHGAVNILAFIGTHSAAQQLHQAHPHPFSVRLALGLDAKNPAIVTSSADLAVAASEVTLGALSFNGQRCTAIKITFVHESIADQFVERLKAQVEKLVIGLPWTPGVSITPVAEPNKPKYHQEVINEAVAKVSEKKKRGEGALLCSNFLGSLGRDWEQV